MVFWVFHNAIGLKVTCILFIDFSVLSFKVNIININELILRFHFQVPKHSTPENNATKPLNIDGSASSIENITPEHLKKDQEFEICFTVDLTVSCKIVVDANKEIKNKTIISVSTCYG